MNNKAQLSIVGEKEIEASEAFFEEFRKLMELYNDEKVCSFTETIKEIQSEKELILFIGESYPLIITALLDAKNQEIDNSRKYSAVELLEILKNHISNNIDKKIEISEEGENLVYKYSKDILECIKEGHKENKKINNIEIKKNTNFISLEEKAKKDENIFLFLDILKENKKLNSGNIMNFIDKTRIYKLEKIINNTDIDKIPNLLEIISNTSDNLIKIVAEVNTDRLTILLNNTNIDKLSQIINDLDTDSLISIIGKVDPNKLSDIINDTLTKDLLEIINNVPTNKIGDILKETDKNYLLILLNNKDTDFVIKTLNSRETPNLEVPDFRKSNKTENKKSFFSKWLRK